MESTLFTCLYVPIFLVQLHIKHFVVVPLHCQYVTLPFGLLSAPAERKILMPTSLLVSHWTSLGGPIPLLNLSARTWRCNLDDHHCYKGWGSSEKHHRLSLLKHKRGVGAQRCNSSWSYWWHWLCLDGTGFFIFFLHGSVRIIFHNWGGSLLLDNVIGDGYTPVEGFEPKRVG